MPSLRAFTHQLTGVGFAAVAVAALDVDAPTAAVLVGAAWLGALLPDADRAGSRVYRASRMERRVWPVRLVGALARLPLRALILLGHRGLTHSLFAAAVAAALAGLFVGVVAPAERWAATAGIAVGYVAHLAGDACTPAGIPAWAPLSRRRRWLLPAVARIRTGSLREYLLAAVLTAALLAATVALRH